MNVIEERGNKLVKGNLAYKYDYTKEDREQKKQSVKKTAPAKHKKAKRNLSYIEKVASVLIVASSAVFMIAQYVSVSETQSALNEIITKYRFEESVTSQKAFELEESIDLSKIETEATSRLGMHRPEKHQVVYLDVKRDDMTVKTADEVEGFSNRFADLIVNIKNHIIDFFSI